MKLSAASSYAVHALVNLAGREQGGPVPSHLVAEAEGMSERFLLKVLGSLCPAQILLGLKGPNGGYRLARPANKITLLDIIEAVDGPIRGDAAPCRWHGECLESRGGASDLPEDHRPVTPAAGPGDRGRPGEVRGTVTRRSTA